MAVSIASRLDHPLLLVLLADGQLRSGEWLAKELKVSRAAVWKAVERLRALGVEVRALPRRGYRLSNPVELLDARRIGAELGPGRMAQLRTLDLMFEVDSTNSRLLGNAPPPPGQADACLSELQHAGRGRRGRRWIAPFGAGVALSVAWTFSDGAGALAALSLGVGVAVARALERAGARGVTLKWPNDIWLRDRKLGGVLIEHLGRAFEYAGTIRARGFCRIPGCLDGPRRFERPARASVAGPYGHFGHVPRRG